MKPNILIGTPAYGGNVHCDYVHSLMNVEAAKNYGIFDYSLFTITNESLITRARNTIISYFYNNNNFTHLLWIDADLGFPANTVPLLLKQEKDIIGCPVPLKGKDDSGNQAFNVGNCLSQTEDGNIVEVDYIGNAMLLMSRQCVDDLCKDADIYKPSNLTRGYRQKEWQYDVFQVGVVDGKYLSEDFWICHKLRNLGYKIYVLLSIPIIHNGNYSF